jgi:hypothetical protein
VNRSLIHWSFDFLRQDVNNNRCAAGVDAYVVVRKKVKLLISFTNVVLVQMPLHYVENAVTAESDFVEMYTLAILPQIYNCGSGIFDTLVELAVGQDVTTETKDDIILAIQASFSCLGIIILILKMSTLIDHDDLPVYRLGHPHSPAELLSASTQGHLRDVSHSKKLSELQTTLRSISPSGV